MNKFLIVGLGNIGSEYENTRHNVGFKCADALAEKHSASFFLSRLAERADVKIKNKQLIIIKPTTYMNLSGKAIKHYLDTEKIPLENTLVIVDDIALPFGSLRLKASGSNGGHNGLKSIEEYLQSQKYARCRFGIGFEFAKGRQVDYVLGQWNTEEQKTLSSIISRSVELVESFALAGLSFTMNNFNGK